MLLRSIILSLVLLIGLGTLIPLATEFAEAGPKKKRKYKKSNSKRVKRYSKRWWNFRRKKARRQKARARQRRARKLRRARLRRARVRRARVRRASLNRKHRLARKRKLRRAKLRRARVRRARLAKNRNSSIKRRKTTAKRRATRRRSTTAKRRSTSRSRERVNYTKTAAPRTNNNNPATLPSGKAAPEGWMSQGVEKGTLQFQVEDSRSGEQLGAASISVVGPAVEGNRVINRRVKTVGGVSTTALRRTVIDQMIQEEGWVVNDYQKEIDGKKVYVVVAQAPGANNQLENRMFYFTEVEGRIYSVATKAPENNSERLAEESEKVLNSLQKNKASQPQIAKRPPAANVAANIAVNKE